MVGTGAMSDPYNPHEIHMELTRHSLELIAAFGFGVSMLTKSTGILRDIPIYQIIAEQAPVNCMLTITTCEDSLSKSWNRVRLHPQRDLPQSGTSPRQGCLPES